MPTTVCQARERRRSRLAAGRAARGQTVPLTAFQTSREVEVRTALRQWRKEVASDTGIHADKILTDATLEHVLARMPTRERDLRAVRGVGPRTVDAYGDAILHIVRQHASLLTTA